MTFLLMLDIKFLRPNLNIFSFIMHTLCTVLPWSGGVCAHQEIRTPSHHQTAAHKPAGQAQQYYHKEPNHSVPQHHRRWRL